MDYMIYNFVFNTCMFVFSGGSHSSTQMFTDTTEDDLLQ